MRRRVASPFLMPSPYETGRSLGPRGYHPCEWTASELARGLFENPSVAERISTYDRATLSRTNIGPKYGRAGRNEFRGAAAKFDWARSIFVARGHEIPRTGSNLVHRICTRISGRFRTFSCYCARYGCRTKPPPSPLYSDAPSVRTLTRPTSNATKSRTLSVAP